MYFLRTLAAALFVIVSAVAVFPQANVSGTVTDQMVLVFRSVVNCKTSDKN
jgi:hypothetical protein